MSNEQDAPNNEVPTSEVPVSAPEATATTPPEPTVMNASPVSTNTAATTKKSSKPKWFIPAIIAGVLLLGGGGAYGYIGVYMQTPEYLYKQAMKYTGKGLKSYVDNPAPAKKGSKISGNFKLADPLPVDGTIEGASNDKNLNLKASVGASGIRANLEVRGLTVANSTYPDLYLKLDGLKGLTGLAGADIGSVVDSVDSKWFMVDHTLFDQAASSLTDSKTNPLANKSASDIQKDIVDLSQKVGTVLSERLFSTDDKTAVVVLKEKLAKEDFKGRKSQHVKVQVRKQQLRDMVVALKDAIKDSKAKELLLMGGDTKKSFEDQINFTDLLKNIDDAKYDDAVADVWIDTGLKTIRNVRIPLMDEKDSKKVTGSLDFMLDYKGGDELPLSITMTNKNSDGDGSVSLGMVLNKKTTAVKFSINLDGTFGGQKVKGNAELTVTGSDDEVKVDKPDGATNIMNLLGSYLGQVQSLQKNLLNSTESTSSAAARAVKCAAEFEAAANTNGKSPISAECQSLDDAEQ